jgi:hypothetical protein
MSNEVDIILSHLLEVFIDSPETEKRNQHRNQAKFLDDEKENDFFYSNLLAPTTDHNSARKTKDQQKNLKNKNNIFPSFLSLSSEIAHCRARLRCCCHALFGRIDATR